MDVSFTLPFKKGIVREVKTCGRVSHGRARRER
jgi:hypothetical protein